MLGRVGLEFTIIGGGAYWECWEGKNELDGLVGLEETGGIGLVEIRGEGLVDVGAEGGRGAVTRGAVDVEADGSAIAGCMYVEDGMGGSAWGSSASSV